jgi:hypothetical protein
VLGDDLPEVHAVQLVPAEYQQVLELVVEKVNQVLAHGISEPADLQQISLGQQPQRLVTFDRLPCVQFVLD